MDIVLCLNDSFISQASVLAVSLLRNSGAAGTVTMFHIFSAGISPENKEKLVSFIRAEGGDASIVDLGDFRERLEQEIGEKPETGKFSEVVLVRLLAPRYLPSTVKKFLYLDADTMVRGDLSELYDTDLSGFFVGASPEPTIYPELVVPQKRAGFPDRAYFNSGVLLVDREAWEEEKITEKCMNCFQEHNGKFGFADQDVLNHVLSGKIRPLPQKFDFFSNYHYLTYREMTKMSPWYKMLVSRKEYEDASENPVIVHFAGDERPWYRGNRNPCRDEYEKYLALTPWKNTEKIPGKERYMMFYHTVNVLSRAVPGFRRLTSKIYRRITST